MRATLILPGAINVVEPASITALIQEHERAGFGFRTPMYRAALAGHLRLLEVLPGARAPRAFLERRNARTCSSLATTAAATTGRRPFRRLAASSPGARTCCCMPPAVSHGTYQMIAETAVHSRSRVLLIETGTIRATAWRELVDAEQERRARARMQPIAALAILTPPGGVHPECAP